MFPSVPIARTYICASSPLAGLWLAISLSDLKSNPWTSCNPPPLAATHEGAVAPLAKVNTSPAGLEGLFNFVNAVVPDAYKISPTAYDVVLVPPLSTATVPVTLSAVPEQSPVTLPVNAPTILLL